jgi:hypothetical protein
MTKINYAAMNDQELKCYILTHRDDQEAFHTYMDRRHSRLNKTNVKLDDPDWEEKVLAAIQVQLNSNSQQDK